MRRSGCFLMLWIGAGCRAANACTVCDSGTARQLRAAIWDGTFPEHLLLMLLPFLVLAAAVALVYRATAAFEEGETTEAPDAAEGATA